MSGRITLPGGLDVSRETSARLGEFVDLLEKWNRAINLISLCPREAIWVRHIGDSAQLLRWAPRQVPLWLDLGSGGGLPAIVVAILGRESGQVDRVVMVESDRRKAVFLEEVVRRLGLRANVVCARIEALEPQGADVISARALADLPQLLRLACVHAKESTVMLFPKGARHPLEVEAAKADWSFDEEIHPSQTESGSAIVALRNVRKNISERGTCRSSP